MSRRAWAPVALVAVILFYVATGRAPYLLWVAGYTALILFFVYGWLTVRRRLTTRDTRKHQ